MGTCQTGPEGFVAAVAGRGHLEQKTLRPPSGLLRDGAGSGSGERPRNSPGLLLLRAEDGSLTAEQCGCPGETLRDQVANVDPGNY